MKKLICFIFLGMAVIGATAAWSKESWVDIDGDGYREAQIVRSGGKIAKTLIDVDHDGRIETVIYYKNGYRDHAEQDLNGDGMPNRWVYYYFTGAAWKIAEDANLDGNPDYWVYLKDGTIYKWEQDRNGDGKPDIKTTYEKDAAGNLRALVQQAYDDDFDGAFEKVSGITMARQEAMLPHSLAEALLR